MGTIFTRWHRKERLSNEQALEMLYTRVIKKENDGLCNEDADGGMRKRSTKQGAFRYYCRALGISWRALDRYLFQELGYHGEEFVQKLKNLE